MTWIPEFVSIYLAGYVIVRFGVERTGALHSKYFVFILAYLTHIAFGLVYNEPKIGVVVAGLRIYLKFLPFFLLPAIFELTRKRYFVLVWMTTCLIILQFPVTLYQKFIEYAGMASGDRIGGTLGFHTSGTLSIFLCMATGMVLSHYLRDFLKFRQMFMLMGLFLAPTVLNETKVTFVVVPLLFVIPVFFSVRDRGRVQKMFPLLAGMGVFLLVFKLIYDSQSQGRWGYGILDFFMDTDQLTRYLELSRFHAIREAIAFVSNDPIHFFLGVGVGNAHDSFDPAMNGAYATSQFEDVAAKSTGLSGV
ncbi:MAG: hypothetical protein H7832_13770, partial [Magnetococcus sp. DMHC-6]